MRSSGPSVTCTDSALFNLWVCRTITCLQSGESSSCCVWGGWEKQIRTSNLGRRSAPRSSCRAVPLFSHNSGHLVCRLIRQPALPVGLFSWGGVGLQFCGGSQHQKAQVQIQMHPSLARAPQATHLPFLSTGGGPAVTTAVLASTGGPPEGGVTGRAGSYSEVPQFSLGGENRPSSSPGHSAQAPRTAETSRCWNQGFLNFPRVLCRLLCALNGRRSPGGGGLLCASSSREPIQWQHPMSLHLPWEGEFQDGTKDPRPPGVHTLSYPCSSVWAEPGMDGMPLCG